MAYMLERYFFSRRGSHLLIDKKDNKGFKVASIKNVTAGVNEMFTVAFEEEPNFLLLPWEFNAETAETSVSVCFFGEDNLYVKGKGKGISLRYADYEGKYIANYCYKQGEKLYLCDFKNMAHQCYSPLKGSVEIDFPRKTGAVCSDSITVRIIPDENGEFEIALEQFYTASRVLTYTDYPYDECVATAKADFEAWATKLQCQTQANYEAAYVLWANTVPACGNFTENAIVMSKAGMTGVWSWDNVIIALALAKYDFNLAYYEFMLPYLHMDEFGCLPDSIRDAYIDRGYVKPPIQGFLYPYFIKRNPEFGKLKVLQKVYAGMKRNTDWWLNCRGEIPAYLHGNDSGADNATCFDNTEYIQSPDLLAFLSAQCDFLADTAKKLGYSTDKRIYKQLADELATKAISQHWDGKKIFVRNAEMQEKYETNSLLPLHLLVIGKRLPAEIKEYIIERLKQHHYSPYGLSSEALDSPLYEEDGYWRGPAWAPNQVIMTFALQAIGETEFAKEIAAKYTNALSKVGFYENISTVKALGLRAKSFAWTASGYFILKGIRI